MKIETLLDAYRNELNKINKSKNSSAGTEDVYKPKLLYAELLGLGLVLLKPNVGHLQWQNTHGRCLVRRP